MFRWDSITSYIKNEINRRVFQILLNIISKLVFFAGLIRLALHLGGDLKNQEYSSYYYFLYVVMTIVSTVGYQNPFGEQYSLIIVVILITISMSMIIPQTSEIIGLLSGNSIYSKLAYSEVEAISHIIITGSVTTVQLTDLLVEFFHEDHGTFPRHCVILSNTRPDNDMENFLRSTEYEKRVYFMQGNPL